MLNPLCPFFHNFAKVGGEVLKERGRSIYGHASDAVIHKLLWKNVSGRWCPLYKIFSSYVFCMWMNLCVKNMIKYIYFLLIDYCTEEMFSPDLFVDGFCFLFYILVVCFYAPERLDCNYFYIVWQVHIFILKPIFFWSLNKDVAGFFPFLKGKGVTDKYGKWCVN